MPNSRTAAAAAVAALVLVAFVLFLTTAGAGEQTVLVANNLLQTTSALGAGVVCGVVAWRGRSRHPAGWAAMAVALAGWGCGQAFWSWQEIVAHREVPFPSLADVGFLVFPVASAAAVLLFQSGTSASSSGLRAMFDGLIVAASLFLVSWWSVLGPVFDAGGENSFAFAVSLAYPIGDLVVMALALLLLSRLATNRLPMALLSAGLLAMGIADSGFLYLTTAGTYHTGSIIDIGWISAFLLCAVAAVADSAPRALRETGTAPARLGLLLPYLPFTAGAAVLVEEAWSSRIERPLIVAGSLLIALILLRQMLVLVKNTELVVTIRQREEQLRYQAFHDPLTGLANRLLFRDRLEHAAALSQRERRDLTVLFLDLDDFKLVNDRLGHAAGDSLLVDVAERLRACLRPGDTVARFGGDEFAVLLEDDLEDAEALAQRIVDALRMPFQLGASRVRVSGSVGVAKVAAGATSEEVSDRLLHRADVAMYTAKQRTKGSYVVFADGMRMAPGGSSARQHTVAG